MTKKKKVIITFSVLFFIVTAYVFIQFSEANNIEETCFDSDFDKALKKENSIRLNEIYNFSKIFNCKSWDEIIIVGGPRANRTAIFFKEGVALPKIDYINRADGSLVFFLVKEGKLISPPISLWQPGFLYFRDFNSFDYICLEREDAVFKCVILETIGFDKPIFTFELINKKNQ